MPQIVPSAPPVTSITMQTRMPSAMPRPPAPIQAPESKQPDIDKTALPSGEQALPAEPKVDNPADLRFAQMARREKQLRQYVKSTQEKEQALKAQEAEIAHLRSLKTRAKEKPLEALQEMGISYEDLTKALIESPTPENMELRKLQAEIKAIKDSQAQQAEEYKKAKEQEYDQAVKIVKNEVKLLVDGNDEFQMIDKTGAHESVVDYIKKTLEATDEWLDVRVAAKEVEEYLLEQAELVAKLPSVQKRLQPQVAPVPEDPNQKQAIQKPTPSPTLTNAVATQTGKTLTARERAILAFEGRLQK